MIPIIALLGSGASITALTTWLGITTSLELQLLIFINVSVLLAVLLRKHPGFPQWFRAERKTSASASAAADKAPPDTSRFITACLGLKKIHPEESSQKHNEQKSRNDEIGKIVQVVEPIDPYTASGKVKYKGIKWPAKSSEAIEQGERVKIIGRDILTLIVEKVNKQPASVKKNSFY